IRSSRSRSATRTAASSGARAASTSSTRPIRASRRARAERSPPPRRPGPRSLSAVFCWPKGPLALHRGITENRGLADALPRNCGRLPAMRMPTPDAAVIARRAEIAAALRRIVPGEGVIVNDDERRVFESDGLTAYRQPPLLAVLPSTTAQVSEILRYCHENGVKVVPRGAGTSLSGGALPLADGIILGLGKFNRVLEIDFANRCAVVQPGVTNLGISLAVQHEGFFYAPDPSSQIACTIGGNIAENSGGVHCLKYGLTPN